MCMIKKIVGFFSWFIVGLVAVVRGMDMVGYPVVSVHQLLAQHAYAVKPLGLVILISGVWSLLTMVGMILGFGKCRGCDCKCSGSCSK